MNHIKEWSWHRRLGTREEVFFASSECEICMCGAFSWEGGWERGKVGVKFLGQKIWLKKGNTGREHKRIVQGGHTSRGVTKLCSSVFSWCRTFCQRWFGYFYQYKKKFVNNKTPEEHGEDQHIICTQTRPPNQLFMKIDKTQTREPQWLSSLALPSAQGGILETQDRVPRQASCMEPASPSACVSASLSVSLMNKQIKSLKKNKEEIF